LFIMNVYNFTAPNGQFIKHICIIIINNTASSNRQDTDFDEFSSGESDQIEEVFDNENTKAAELINGPSIGRCRVIYDYDANMFDELTIRSGEIINVHDKQDDGWWLGELRGVVGIFPGSYIELIEDTVVDTSDKV